MNFIRVSYLFLFVSLSDISYPLSLLYIYCSFPFVHSPFPCSFVSVIFPLLLSVVYLQFSPFVPSLSDSSSPSLCCMRISTVFPLFLPSVFFSPSLSLCSLSLPLSIYIYIYTVFLFVPSPCSCSSLWVIIPLLPALTVYLSLSVIYLLFIPLFLSPSFRPPLSLFTKKIEYPKNVSSSTLGVLVANILRKKTAT